MMMKNRIGVATTLATATLLFALPATNAFAQAEEVAAPVPARRAQTETDQADLKPLSEVLLAISKESGVQVVADSSVATIKVAPPTVAITPENLDLQLSGIIRKLPRGTTWAKLFLPEKLGGYKGDDLTDYALAQAKLFGNVGGSADATSIEVLGKKVSGERADVVSNTLNLRPIYLIANPATRTVAGKTTAAAPDWDKMTPEQREAYNKRRAQDLLSMSPEARGQAMQGMFEQQIGVMQQLMQSMSPEQRGQLMQSMQGGMMRMFPGGGDRRQRGNRGGGGNGNIVIPQPNNGGNR